MYISELSDSDAAGIADTVCAHAMSFDPVLRKLAEAYRSEHKRLKIMAEVMKDLERALQTLGDKYILAVRVCEEASTLAHNLGWDEDRYICQALETWRKGAL